MLQKAKEERNQYEILSINIQHSRLGHSSANTTLIILYGYGHTNQSSCITINIRAVITGQLSFYIFGNSCKISGKSRVLLLKKNAGYGNMYQGEG